jgi:hypothetical protein
MHILQKILRHRVQKELGLGQTQAIGDEQGIPGVAMAMRFKTYDSRMRDFPSFLDQRTSWKLNEQGPGYVSQPSRPSPDRASR